jgi:hypothetical protein
MMRPALLLFLVLPAALQAGETLEARIKTRIKAHKGKVAVAPRRHHHH